MKLTVVLLITTFIQVSAGSFAQQLTLTKKNISLEQIFKEIKKQTGFNVVYSDRLVDVNKTVDVNFNKGDLQTVLNFCLENQALVYTIEEKTIVIKQKEPSLVDHIKTALPIPISVSGRVTDTIGTPLVGATVINKNAGRSTLTNDNGEFSLIGQKGDQITVTFIGYQSYAFTITRDLGFEKIVLHGESNKLQEVKVTMVNNGYQTLSKERSTGSFAKPDMSIVASRSFSMNVLQRLDGLVPGLTVNNAPGAAQFLIRGLSTLGVYTDTNPLIVVDGMQIKDITSINPNDVADITVLKDATAASIWGARAANGVIVITTKRGTNKPMRVEYDGFINMQGKPQIDYYPVLNSQQFIQAAKLTFDPVTYPYSSVSTQTYGATLIAPHETILYNQYRGLISAATANRQLDSLASINNVKQMKDIWYRNAVTINQTVSVTGGIDRYNFYGSLSNTDIQSSTPGSSDKRYKINLRQDYTFNKNLQMYLVTDLTNEITRAKRAIAPDDRFLPYVQFKDGGGNSLSMSWLNMTDSARTVFQNKSKIDLNYNPLDDFNSGYTNSNALLGRISSGITLKIVKGLRFEGVYGTTLGANKTISYDDISSFQMRYQLLQFTVAPTTTGGNPTYYLPTTRGQNVTTNLTERDWTVRNQLIYDNSWDKGKHQLTVLAGQEAQQQLYNTTSSTILGYDGQLLLSGLVDYYTLANTGVANPIIPTDLVSKSFYKTNPYSESESLSRFTSYYSNIAYTFNHKYSLNAATRLDQSNLFGKDKSAQNKPVWSLGGSWLLSNEHFMEAATWLNRLALRTTYGLTGNSPNPGTSASYDILTANSSPIAPGNIYLDVLIPANRLLTWETTRNLNVGIDFFAFKNRLGASVDVYYKNTNNLIANIPINSFTGYSSLVGNLGDVTNKGIEIQLNSVNLLMGKFRWTSLLSAAYNVNKITKLLYDASAFSSGGDLINQHYLPGYSAFSLFAYRFAGLDNLGDPQIRLADGTVTKARNQAKPADMVYMGTYQPKWSGGLNNTFSYKNFSLSANMVFNLGNVMRRDVNETYTGRLIPTGFFGNSTFTSGNINADFENRWQKSGDEAITNIPSYVSNETISNSRRNTDYYTQADINVISASFVKMRDITLMYNLPVTTAQKLRVKNISLRAQVNNFMLWKANHDGIDPEFQLNTYIYGRRTTPTNQHAVTLGLHVIF